MSIAKKRPRSDILPDYQPLTSAQENGLLAGLGRLAEKALTGLKKLIGQRQQETLVQANRRHNLQVRLAKPKQHDPKVVARVELAAKGFTPPDQSIKQWQVDAAKQEENVFEASLMKRCRPEEREETAEPPTPEKRLFRFPAIDSENSIQWHLIEKAFKLELEEYNQVSQEQIEENAKDTRSLKERLFGKQEEQAPEKKPTVKEKAQEDQSNAVTQEKSEKELPLSPGVSEALGDKKPSQNEAQKPKPSSQKEEQPQEKKPEDKPVSKFNPFISERPSASLSLNTIIGSQQNKTEQPLFKSSEASPNRVPDSNSSLVNNPIAGPLSAASSFSFGQASALGPMVKKGQGQIKPVEGLFARGGQSNAQYALPKTSSGGMFDPHPSDGPGLLGPYKPQSAQVNDMFGKTAKHSNQPSRLFDSETNQTKPAPRKSPYRGRRHRDKGVRVSSW